MIQGHRVAKLGPWLLPGSGHSLGSKVQGGFPTLEWPGLGDARWCAHIPCKCACVQERTMRMPMSVQEHISVPVGMQEHVQVCVPLECECVHVSV